jgi:hypothetical protein
MPRFLICPSDQAFSSVEFIAPDAAGILNMVHRLECKEADVMRDGIYSFSVRLGDNGIWCIFQREPTEQIQAIPVTG